jgi:hypothetical protein
MYQYQYCEPSDDNNGVVTITVTKEEAIRQQRERCVKVRGVDLYKSDEEALTDFICLHWALKVRN